MALIQTVHLSMANFKSAPVVPAVQNDTDRQVKMVLDDYTLTSGLTGKIAFERSDGTHYETAAELVLADNAFVADIDQALTQPGRTMVQLKVTDTLTVSTFSFVIFVESDYSGTVTPQESIDLVTAVEAAEAAADRAESAAAEAGGLSNQAKQALLACFANVAWINDDGQDYYDALENALYPVTPVTLVSISAVYTQTGTVYDTDSLDSLKADLVVTGNYDDSTTAVISTGYTLSGTLTVGTSTITVSYSEKTTTFTATVTAGPLHILTNGTHEFTTANAKGYVTITDHSHIKIDRTEASSSGTNRGYNFICLSDLEYNGASITSNTNINNHSSIFQLSSGDEVRFVVSNVTGSFDDYTIGLRKANGTTNVAAIANQTTDADNTVTVSSTDSVGCLFFYVGTQDAATKDIEADIEVYVNGTRYF